ncbi:MAG TPA: OmpA family protein, partial [Saprospiraceae bacterium]|nr:OmpA family protein [Saprospiraceae bacterium]
MKRYALMMMVLVFSGASQLFSQPMNRSTSKVMLTTAEERYDSMDYYNALEWFEKLNDENKKDQYSTFKIAELQFKLRDYKRAADWYAKGFRRDKKNEYAEEKFTYARALKMNGQYEDAMVQFSEFIQTTQNPILKTLAEAELQGCQMAPKAPVNERLKVENAGKNINKATSELSPYLSSDGSELYFASLHSDSAVTLNGKQGDYYLKIFTSKRDGDKWGAAVPITPQVNREEFHNGNACVSRDGKTMYFTRASLTGNIVTESKIFVASYSTDGWGAATEVAGINGAFLSKHPMIGELFGREVLFFVSDMPGGYGGFDIYYANRKSDNAFGDPVNLGKEINTVGDDETPFYKEGKLYFSSTGWPGLGGFDIFSSSWSGTNWGTPVNLGKGYNTSFDDMYFSNDKEGYTGFLVSNRPEGKSIKSKTCCDDIYMYNIEKYKAEVISTVFDASSNKVVQGVDVQLVDMTGGKMGMTDTKNTGKTNVSSFPLTLEKTYTLIFTKEGYYPDTIKGINTVALSKSEVYNKKVNLKPKEPEYEIYSTEESIRLNNIYYDYDDDKILKDAEGDLSLIFDLMKQYPDMVIELGSHTDARGDDDYNLKLSQRRANSAKTWLVSKGIVATRINAVGYGETKILNKCANGVECTDDEHRFN